MKARDKGFFEAKLREMASNRRTRALLYAAAGQPVTPVHWPEGWYRHVPDWYEITYAISGAYRVVSTSGVFTLTPDNLLLIDRGVEHAEFTADPPCPYHAFWCSVGSNGTRLSNTWFPPDAPPRPGFSIEFIGRTDVEALVQAIGSELSRRDVGWQKAVSCLFQYLSTILIRRVRRDSILSPWAAEAPSVTADPGTWHTIRVALQFCARNLGRRVTVPEVAAAVPCDPKHLNRLFSRTLGISISDQLRSMRMEAAKQLLEKTALSLASIASSVGYSDHSHFTRAFMRVTGVSPKQFRRDLSGH